MIINSHDLLYIHFKRFLLILKRLSDVKVVSLTKEKNGTAVYFYQVS